MKKYVFLVLALFSFCVSATGLTGDNRKAVDNRLGELKTELERGNVAAAINLMPLEYLDVLAQKMGLTRGMFIQMLIEDSAKATNKEKIEKFTYDLDRAEVFKSSRSRTYAFIPTVIRAKVDGKTIENVGYYLGIKERRYWYFIGWEKEMIPQLLEAYPDLSERKLPK